MRSELEDLDELLVFPSFFFFSSRSKEKKERKEKKRKETNELPRVPPRFLSKGKRRAFSGWW